MFFFAAIQPAVVAAIVDVVPVEVRSKKLSIMGAANGMGMLIGPALGGLLVFKYEVIKGVHMLIFPLVVMLLLLVLVIYFVNKIPTTQTNVKEKITSELKWYHRSIRFPLVTMFVTMSMSITINMCLVFYIQDMLQLKSELVAPIAGTALAGVGITIIVVQLILSRIGIVNFKRNIIAAALITAFAAFLITVWPTKIGIIVSSMISAIGMSVLFPTMQTLLANSVQRYEQGVAAGYLSSAQAVAMVIMPVIVTSLYTLKPQAPYLMMVAMMLLLAVLTRIFVKKKSVRHKPSTEL